MANLEASFGDFVENARINITYSDELKGFLIKWVLLSVEWRDNMGVDNLYKSLFLRDPKIRYIK